jgi:hypothetical protein
MVEDRNRDQDMPNRQSNMEKAEGSRPREQGNESESGTSQADRDRRHGNTGGITNRPLDRERTEQANLPERGDSQPER